MPAAKAEIPRMQSRQTLHESNIPPYFIIVYYIQGSMDVKVNPSIQFLTRNIFCLYVHFLLQTFYSQILSAVLSHMNKKKGKKLALPLFFRLSRPFLDERQVEDAKNAARDIPAGYPLAKEAERHGLAPLVFHHLKKMETAIDETEVKKLRIQFFRNGNRNRVLMNTLEEILMRFRQENIDLLILKGGALCNLIYSDKALRPMGDLDLLVREEDGGRACDKLLGMGFNGTPVEKKHHLRHAILQMSQAVDGVHVDVDLHKNVFTNLHPLSLTLDTVGCPLIPFQVGSQTAFTLGYTEMLLHLCHHLITPGQPMKLISVADIMGFTTHYVDEIDWKQLHESHRFVINALCMLDLIVPLSDETRRKAGFEKPGVENDLGMDYTGWPTISFRTAKEMKHGYRRLLQASTTAAPEWWLRLRYGYEERYPIWFCRYVLHPLRLSVMASRWFLS